MKISHDHVFESHKRNILGRIKQLENLLVDIETIKDLEFGSHKDAMEKALKDLIEDYNKLMGYKKD